MNVTETIAWNRVLRFLLNKTDPRIEYLTAHDSAGREAFVESEKIVLKSAVRLLTERAEKALNGAGLRSADIETAWPDRNPPCVMASGEESRRDAEIRHAFDGRNACALAEKYRLSPQRIYNILKKCSASSPAAPAACSPEVA